MKMTRLFWDVCIKNLLPLILLIISVIGIVTLQLVPPQILKAIVDDYLDKGIYDGVTTLAVIYLAAVLVSYICEFFKTVFTTYIGQKAILEIRYRMSEKLTRLPMRYYNKNATGDVMSRFTQDVEAVNTLFSDGLVNMAVDLFKIIGIIVSVFLLNKSLFIYTLLIIPVVVVISNAFRKRVYAAQLSLRKAIGKMNSFIQEAFSGLRLFKIFGYENRLSHAFNPLTDEQIGIRRKVNRMDSIFPCIMQILKAVIICSFVVLTTKEVNLIAGVTIGTLAAAIDLLGRLFAPIEELATEFQTIQQVLAAFHRITEFLDEKEETRMMKDEAEPDGKNDILFQNVSFAYDDAGNILSDVSFRVKKGLKVALVGRTGSGKTTILNLLAGLYPAGTGNITICGYDPFTMPAEIRRRVIGIVPQTVTTFTGKIKDIITLGDKQISETDVIEALKAVGLYEEIEKLPQKHNTVIGEGESNLSFGQMQLLTLARAIVTNPPLLLLDELTSGLDAVTEAGILKAIKNVSANRTIVTISHRLSGMIDADYVYVCSHGKIVEEGKPDELVQNNGWYAKYKQLEDMGWQADGALLPSG